MRNLDGAARLNLLVVDDDRSELALFGLAIERSPRDIWLQTASDGQRAIDLLSGRDIFADRQLHPLPDLVVLDLDMPLSGGFDFLDWRSASPEFSALPVVVLSGWAYPGAIQAALALGANASISKPAHLQDWSPIVEQIWNVAVAWSHSSARTGI